MCGYPSLEFQSLIAADCQAGSPASVPIVFLKLGMRTDGPLAPQFSQRIAPFSPSAVWVKCDGYMPQKGHEESISMVFIEVAPVKQGDDASRLAKCYRHLTTLYGELIQCCPDTSEKILAGYSVGARGDS